MRTKTAHTIHFPKLLIYYKNRQKRNEKIDIKNYCKIAQIEFLVSFIKNSILF